MRSRFAGFHRKRCSFSAGWRAIINASGFNRAKSIFEQQVKQPMRELVEALNGGMKSFAPEYATDPEKAIYRIYRDTRFSKDKTPYKDHIGASFYRQRNRAA